MDSALWLVVVVAFGVDAECAAEVAFPLVFETTLSPRRLCFGECPFHACADAGATERRNQTKAKIAERMPRSGGMASQRERSTTNSQSTASHFFPFTRTEERTDPWVLFFFTGNCDTTLRHMWHTHLEKRD